MATDENKEQVILFEQSAAQTNVEGGMGQSEPEDKDIYYSTIASFYHIWLRERAKYETVIHCSVPV